MGLNWRRCLSFRSKLSLYTYVKIIHNLSICYIKHAVSHSRWKRKYIGTAYCYELINRQISHCWLRNTLIGLLFDLKTRGFSGRLAISTFHAFVTLLASRVRLLMGLELRVWSLLLANGAMDLEHWELLSSILISHSPSFFSFLILVISDPDLIIWFKFLVPVFFFIFSPFQFPDPAGTHQGN